jgi:predicted O-methyltransferase YrrM
MSRLHFFKDKLKREDDMFTPNRFWWFAKNDYLPGIYAELSDEEFDVLVYFFEETEKSQLIGECNIPLMSEMLGFIDGSNLGKIVQLGHYAGWSSLMFGWKLRRMGKQKALFSMDVLPEVTDFANRMIEEAGLQEVVKLVVGNSCNMEIMMSARDYLGESPDMIFIDSSHQYLQTVEELHLWYPALKEGGLIFLHDTGQAAIGYDKTGQGGVRRAIEEWRQFRDGLIMLNRTIPDGGLVRQDICGATIIQKAASDE